MADSDDSNNRTGTFWAEIMRGTDADETLDGAGGRDVIDGGGGNDSIRGGDASMFDMFFGTQDLLMGGSGNDTIEGGAGRDLGLGGSGDDSVDGGVGADTLRGGSGDDTVLGGADNDVVLGDSGDDSVDGGTGDDLVRGGTGNDTVTGGEGNDSLYGDSGDDSVDGGAGDDWLYAGVGNDTLTGGSGEDTFAILQADGGTSITDFDTGNDKIYLGALADNDGEPPTLADLLDDITDESGNAVIDFTDWGGGTVTLEGVSKNDLMDGAVLNADLFDYGHDTVEGDTGNDIFYMGAGDQEVTGGGGSDRFIFYDNHGDDIITDFSVDDDLIHLGSLTTAITADQLLGKMTDTDTDNDSTNDAVVIDLSDFGGGTLTLQGVLKADLMDGSTLNTDLFVLPDGTTNTWTGTDRTDGVAGGEADLNFVAKDGADWVFAGEGNDTVDGAGGDDRMFGEEGDDSITGGTGDDIILGGEGNDTINAGADDDVVYGGEGDDSIDGGAGDDWIRGEAGNDTIDGGDGADTIFGSDGDDSITGGNDADTFVFGDGHGNDIITDFADGTDIIDLSDVTGALDFDDLTITADGNDAVIDTGEGEITLSGVSTSDLDAANFVFSTTGGSGNETIDGGAGDDIIDGGAGDDSLTGGADADTFVFRAGHGNDTIADFTDGEDIIDVSSLGITGISSLTFSTNADNDLVINTGEGNGTIVLEGVTDLATLTGEDFIFADPPPPDNMGDSM